MKVTKMFRLLRKISKRKEPRDHKVIPVMPPTKELSFCHKLNFFLYSTSLQPDGLNLGYFKHHLIKHKQQ